MARKDDLDLVKLSEGVVDYFWHSAPSVEVDHSARKGAANRLILSIASEIIGLNRDQAHERLMTLLEEGGEFRSSIQSIIESAISDFKEHYTKFGGKSALFAFCLLLSLTENDGSNEFRAKASLLNWYAEERRLNRTLVDGGHVGAGWPYDWFCGNFDSIAASFIASIFFSATGALVNKVLKAFRKSFDPIKRSFNPYPASVLVGKSPEQTIEDFNKELDRAGLTDRFLYLFKLNDEELNALVEGWLHIFVEFRNSLSSGELKLLSDMIEGPIHVSGHTKNSRFLEVVESFV